MIAWVGTHILIVVMVATVSKARKMHFSDGVASKNPEPADYLRLELTKTCTNVAFASHDAKMLVAAAA